MKHNFYGDCLLAIGIGFLTISDDNIFLILLSIFSIVIGIRMMIIEIITKSFLLEKIDLRTEDIQKRINVLHERISELKK